MAGITPLHFAIFRGNAFQADQIIASGEADVDAADSNGQTPMHMASYRDNAQVLAKLIEAGADHSKTDAAGNTPLHAAAGSGATTVVQHLVEKGLLTVKERNREGLTAFEVAQRHCPPVKKRHMLNIFAELANKSETDCDELDGDTSPAKKSFLETDGRERDADLKSGAGNVSPEADRRKLQSTRDFECALGEMRCFGPAAPGSKGQEKPTSMADPANIAARPGGVASGRLAVQPEIRQSEAETSQVLSHEYLQSIVDRQQQTIAELTATIQTQSKTISALVVKMVADVAEVNKRLDDAEGRRD